jgi:beta-N-acetylhexosaminidase
MKWFLLFFFPFALFSMTLEEKVGTLFIAPACPLGGEKHHEDLLDLIDRLHIGGVIFKASDAASQVAFIEKLQKEHSLLVVLDAEWGLGMRVTDGISFPKNLTLGAVQEESLLFALGKEIGKECRAIGAHINLAPVVDVNSNPSNPIIHTRSFGEDSSAVARKAKILMQGMREGGIMTCAKHFPGHGDTSIDSHLDMPQVTHMELAPFQELIDAGVDCVLSAHLSVPSVDLLPSTLSRKLMHDLLQDKMGFQGLVITDALNMNALAKYFSAEEIALLAYEAGNDLLLYGDHIAPNIEKILHEEIPRAYSALLKAFKEGRLDEKELDRRVAKILKHKTNVTVDLSKICTQQALALKEKLFEEAMTLVREDVPLPIAADCPLLSIGRVYLGKGLHIPMNAKESELSEVLTHLEGKPEVVIALSSVSQHGLNPDIVSLIEKIREKAKVILIVFGTPYALRYVDGDTVLVAYEEDLAAQRAALKVLSGQKNAKGKLPVTCGNYQLGTGL